MNISKVAGKIQVQIHHFSGKLSQDLPKVAQRFVEEVIYGIQTHGFVRLSEIARSLNESIPLCKTINRLSRQLKRPGLRKHITDAVMREAASLIKEDTLLIVDPTDIIKPYARKMEYLARIRDGSKKEIGDGYWVCQVVGAECGESSIIPLYNELYSQRAPDFDSENREILKAVDSLASHIKNRGIYVSDRAGDRGRLLYPLLDKRKRFLIRLVGDRHLVYRGKKSLALDLARSCPLPYADRIIKEDKGKEKAYTLEYGFRKVRLPGRTKQLYLVVVKGFGEKPMMLLTNVEMRKKRTLLWWAVCAYLTCWRIEETIRFIKQSYHLEDIRLLTYDRLKNMMALVLASSYFAAVYLGMRAKLEILTAHVLKAAKRIFGIPDFRYYAIADGIRELLNRHNKGILRPTIKDYPIQQLSFFDLLTTS
jgi:hypothetical protein